MAADFKRLVYLTEDQEKVLDCWVKKWSLTRSATFCNMTDRNVSDIRRELREMYDQVQIYSPLLPARK